MKLVKRLWWLHGQVSLPPRLRFRLQSVCRMVSAEPARVTVGGMFALDNTVLVTLVNVALTYCFILYQYRPSDYKGLMFPEE